MKQSTSTKQNCAAFNLLDNAIANFVSREDVHSSLQSNKCSLNLNPVSDYANHLTDFTQVSNLASMKKWIRPKTSTPTERG